MRFWSLEFGKLEDFGKNFQWDILLTDFNRDLCTYARIPVGSSGVVEAQRDVALLHQDGRPQHRHS